MGKGDFVTPQPPSFVKGVRFPLSCQMSSMYVNKYVISLFNHVGLTKGTLDGLLILEIGWHPRIRKSSRHCAHLDTMYM